ncbi:MAG: EAL domain-containing protein, partial [Pseudomonadales bacterium]
LKLIEENVVAINKSLKQKNTVPLSGMSIVDKDNVWLKARLGIEANCLDREGAFCSHAIESEQDVYCVEDTLEHTFYKSHPLVRNFGIRFYAAAVLKNAQGYPIGTVWVMDVKPRKLLSSERTILKSLAANSLRMLDYKYTSSFTGLQNRKSFITSLQQLMDLQIESSEASVAVKAPSAAQGVIGVMVLDNLDIISSIFGEEGTNDTLDEIAQRLKRHFPKESILAHIEDNTFAFANLSTTTEQEFPYQAIKEKLTAPVTIQGSEAQLQVSCGFTTFPENGNSGASLLFQALTSARRAKNTDCMAYPQSADTLSDSVYIKTLHRTLKLGLAQEELAPFYQPQINSETHQLSGLESLARWKSPVLGNVPPFRFIDLAEESGLICQLDFLMLEKVCLDIKRWKALALPIVPVSVNLSRASVAHAATPERVAKILAEHAVEHEYVKIEITESTMISDYDPVLDNITRLRTMGLPVSIDDFGTGFSNLSTLRLLTFDQLKVDRQFVHNISHCSSTSGLFEFIKNVGALFSANLMCEGMEKKEDVEHLMRLGCYNHQGWFYSKALNFDGITSAMYDLQSAQQTGSAPGDHLEMAEFWARFQQPRYSEA